MHSLSWRFVAAAFVMAVGFPAPCMAQFGGGVDAPPRDANTSRLTRSVLLKNAAGVNEITMGQIAAELSRTWRVKESGKLGDLLSVSLAPAMTDGTFNSGDYGGLRIRSLSVNVTMPDDQYDGELLERRWQDARKELQGALQAAQRTMVQQQEEARSRAREANDAQRARLNAECAEIYQLLEEAGGTEGSPEKLREQLDETNSMLRQLALDRVSMEARRQAIEERVDELLKLAHEAEESDPIIVELLKIQEIRQQQLENVRMRHSVGQATPAEVNQAEADMANARIDLLKAQRGAADRASGGVLEKLNNELSNLIVQLAEIDARTGALEKLASHLRDQTSVEVTTQRAMLVERLSLLKGELARVQAKQLDLSDQPPIGIESLSITPLDEALGLGADAGNGENTGEAQ